MRESRSFHEGMQFVSVLSMRNNQMFRFDRSVSRAARWLAVLCLLSAPLNVSAQEPSHSGDPAGCWKGNWRSFCTSHKGKLSAKITPCCDGRYRAIFRGTFFKILCFKYTVTLNAEPADETGEVYHLYGSSDLGRLAGGVYHYDGYATATEFRVNYRSKDDKGVFAMHRTCCH